MADVMDLTTLSTTAKAPKWTLRGRAESEPRRRGPASPGPGQYGTGLKTDKDKYFTAPNFGFGTSSRDGRGWSTAPGPGRYAPFHAGAKSEPKYGFGSSTRSAMKRSMTPGPGSYDTRGNLDGMQKSFSARHLGSSKGASPGPGAYTPGFAQTIEVLPRWGIGSGNRAAMDMSKAPGPGTYESLKTLGGNVVNNAAPSFSMKPRRAIMKSDTTPAPGAPFTQFK